jgi:hypothetical protein
MLFMFQYSSYYDLRLMTVFSVGAISSRASTLPEILLSSPATISKQAVLSGFLDG